MKFRPQALERLQKPIALDAPIQLAKPRSLLSLTVVALLIIGGVTWALTGSIPRQTSAKGILTHAEGSIFLESAYTGQITGVFVQPGSVFPTNTPLFTVATVGGSTETVRSITGGRIISMIGDVGLQVSTGTQLAVIERIDQVNDPLVADIYVPQSSAGLVRVGAQVDLDVVSAPSAAYGVLRGTVQSISQFPQTEAQVASSLGDPSLAKAFSAAGQPMSVIVSLTPDPSTQSGLSWSNGSGPPFQIDSRTLVTVSIHLAPIRPVDWVVA